MVSVAKRIIKQLLYDKRSMMLMVFGPIFLVTLMFMLLGKTEYKPTVAFDKVMFEETFSSKVSEILEKKLEENNDIVFKLLPQDTAISQYIEDKKADAVLTINELEIELVMLELVATKASILTEAIRSAMSDLSTGTGVNLSILYGETNESTFDSLAYYLLGVLSFFLIFIFAGISFVRERTTNTLERLMRTPVRSISVVGGYSLGFCFFAVLQSVLLILYSKFVLDTLFIGEWWLAMLFMILIAVVAVMLGMFVSVISKSEFQVVQAIPILIVPQIFFSGLIPVDMLPYHLNLLSYFMPLYYSGMGLKYVMVYGYGIDKVWQYIAVLLGIIAVIFIANVVVVEKTRRS